MLSKKLEYQPEFSFVTASIGGENYHYCASRLISTVRSKITSNIHCLTDDNLNTEIEPKYLKILDRYKIDLRETFIWKPWLILTQLNKLKNNGILLYIDAGSEISINNHSLDELNRLFREASQKGSIFFCNNYDSNVVADKDAVSILSNYFGKEIQSHEAISGGFLILRNDAKTFSIIRKWCYLSLVQSGLIFKGKSGRLGHRHDQYVLGYIIFDEKIKLHKLPAWFESSLYFYPSTLNYPIHNNRNNTNFSYLKSFLWIKKLYFFRFLGRFQLDKLLLKILYYLKKNTKKFFYHNLICPEFLTYKSDEFEKDSDYVKTPGRLPVLFKDRRTIKGIKIQNSMIFSDGTIIYNKKFLYSHKKLYGEKQHEIKKKFFKSLKKNTFQKNSVVLCLNQDSHNLYHFIYDCFMHSMSYFDKKRTILLGEGLIELKTKLFTHLGYDFKFIEKKQSCYANELYLYDLPDYSGQPSKKSVLSLKNYFCNHFDLEDLKFSKNYIIHRTLKDGRSILFSEEQKKVLLDEFKFEIVDLSKKNLIEQMKIFSNANKIIAPGGAGLSWLFLCNLSANIIEIRSLVNENASLEKIAGDLNLNYSYFYETIGKKNRFNVANVSNPNIFIDDFLFSKIVSNIK